MDSGAQMLPEVCGGIVVLYSAEFDRRIVWIWPDPEAPTAGPAGPLSGGSA